jgi:hypothetical protein
MHEGSREDEALDEFFRAHLEPRELDALLSLDPA